MWPQYVGHQGHSTEAIWVCTWTGGTHAIDIKIFKMYMIDYKQVLMKRYH